MTFSNPVLRHFSLCIISWLFTATAVSCKDDAATSYCKMSDAESTVSSTSTSEDAGSADAGGTTDSKDTSDSKDAADADAGPSSSGVDFTRLYCVEYSTNDDKSLKINLINYWADCGGPFKAEITDGSSTSLKITVTPDQCGSSGCVCPYDFSLNASGFNSNAPIDVTIDRFSCITMDAASYEKVTLALNKSKDGIICQYFGSTGGIHGLCEDEETCDEGLVCRDSETLSGFERVCLVPCKDRFDCPVPDAFTCDEGACHVIPNMTQTVG